MLAQVFHSNNLQTRYVRTLWLETKHSIAQRERTRSFRCASALGVSSRTRQYALSRNYDFFNFCIPLLPFRRHGANRPGVYSRLHGLQNFREGLVSLEEGATMDAIVARIRSSLTGPSLTAAASETAQAPAAAAEVRRWKLMPSAATPLARARKNICHAMLPYMAIMTTARTVLPHVCAGVVVVGSCFSYLPTLRVASLFTNTTLRICAQATKTAPLQGSRRRKF